MKDITNANIVSTKKGDTGMSRNYSNEKLHKTDTLFETLGSLDELSSSLGVAYHYVNEKKEIQMVQKDLQNIMSLIATNPNDKNYQKLVQIQIKDVNNLENIEQSILSKHPLKPRFVLPGSDSSVAGSYVDLSRSIARRTERQVLRFIGQYTRDDLALVMKYLNRLSDFLYIMARSYDSKKA
jgi:cob(I)alamin adenosyltransferase